MMTASGFIELPEKEVEAKTGVFHNPATGAMWKLSRQNEKLMVDVPNFSFQIAPLSETKFLPVHALMKIEIEFEKQGHNQPLLMHLYAKGMKRATFETI